MLKRIRESRRPPSNKPAKNSSFGYAVFVARRMLDLQLHTVVRDIKPWLATREGSVLDVGCGDQPYRSFLPKSCTYLGLDWQESDTKFSMTNIIDKDIVYFDGKIFPFPDNTFDSLFHTEVLEHVKDYIFFLKECHRVLKPGGEMIMTVPFQARYHFIPFDYWRFTRSGLEESLMSSGFTNLHIFPRGTDITVATYKIISVLYRWAFSGLLGKIAFIILLWVVAINIFIAHLSLFFGWGSTDDCLGYTVKAECRKI